MTDETIFEVQLAALMRVVAAAFAAAGLVPEGPAPAVFSVAVRRLVVRMLSPAEAALRRLIFYRAQELSVSAGSKRAAPSKPINKGSGARDRVPPFRLFDPRKWFAELAKTRRGRRAPGPGPRISSFDEPRPVYEPSPPPPSEAELDPMALCRRLQALHKALHDIPGQAKRMARMMARRKAASKPAHPLRRGPPPGHRETQSEDIDEILAECQTLVLKRVKKPDRA